MMLPRITVCNCQDLQLLAHSLCALTTPPHVNPHAQELLDHILNNLSAVHHCEYAHNDMINGALDHMETTITEQKCQLVNVTKLTWKK